jgi:hypothetical protein
MLGIVVNLPPVVAEYLQTTTIETMAAQALLLVGWVPIFGVLVWGMAHVWLDFKQEKFAASLHWILLEVRVPQTAIQTPKGMDVFFSNLAGVKSGITWREHWLLGKFNAPFSFEIASNGGRVGFYIRCVDKYRDLVEADLYAQYPEAQITEVEDYAASIPVQYPDPEWEVFGAEFVLKNPSFFPIRTYEDFEHQGEKEGRFKDPLLSVIELMGKIRAGENYWVQIMIQTPDDQGWTKDGIKFAAKVMGKEEKKQKSMSEQLLETAVSFPQEVITQISGIGGGGATAEKKADDFKMFKLTPAEKLQIDAVTDKISKIGWNAKIRVLYSAKKNKFRKGLLASAGKGIFQPFGNAVTNQFAAHGPSVPKDDYFWMEWTYAGKQTKLAKRYVSRNFGAGSTPFILNSEELATLWHFPAADARTPVLAAMGARRAEAPSDLYYADDADGDGIPDWKQRYGKAYANSETESATEEVSSLPKPSAPTFTPGEVPVPGRPAPLPPGLDLSDEPMPTDQAAPGNLPL